MASIARDPRSFFAKGTYSQYEYIISYYEEAIKLKANQKNKNFEDMLKLDKWYQVELPKAIKKRGKEPHLTHEEMVKCMRWKLSRGKFSPRLKDLITMNTPRMCVLETKKAFRILIKKNDLQSSINALCNLKGVGPAMASAILTAGCPEEVGFMADECMMAIPEIESIDYTTRELLTVIEQLKATAGRLNKESGTDTYNPHKVEKALWAHFVFTELGSELLDNMPGVAAENGIATDDDKNGPSPSPSDSSADKENRTQIHTNGASEDSRSALSLCEDTNDSIPMSETPSALNSESNNIDSVNHSEVEEDSQDTRDSKDMPSSSSNSPSPSPKSSPAPPPSTTQQQIDSTTSSSSEQISNSEQTVRIEEEKLTNNVENNSSESNEVLEDKPSEIKVLEDKSSENKEILEDKPSKSEEVLEDKPSKIEVLEDKSSKDEIMEEETSESNNLEGVKSTKETINEVKPSKDSSKDSQPSNCNVDNGIDSERTRPLENDVISEEPQAKKIKLDDQ